MEKKFEMGPLLFLVFACILALAVIAGQPAADGWQEQNGGLTFYRSGEPLTGWQELDGSRYYFGADGLLLTGWQEIDGSTYYLGTDGIMRTGWQTIDGNTYYLTSDGARLTGRQTIDGRQYHFGAGGALGIGIMEENGARYLYDELGLVVSRWAQFGSKLYYGDEKGRPVSGWVEIEGKQHYFEETGTAASGWLQLGDFFYYFHGDGSPAQGEEMVGGATYHFASNGQMILLVNPWHPLPDNYTVELVPISDTHKIAKIAYSDYLDMMADCAAAGFNPAVCSSYRTQEYQDKLYQNRILRYVWAGYNEEEATELAGQSVAVPGTSEHQLGLALDIVDDDNWKLDESQAKMPTQKWLMENSWRYGWILRYPTGKSEITGIIYEPWHYRYVGKTVAKEIYESGLCLEEYLQMLTNSVG